MDRGYSTHSRHLVTEGLEKEDQAVLTQLKKVYWTTKQQLRKTIGKKEDEHITASDADLDAKLELFEQIQLSCIELLQVILTYQKRLFTLAKEENAMGKFLTSQSDEDVTQAGKMMSAVGKSLMFSAQHRVHMRHPLYRLFQEVETFRTRAIKDTQVTIGKMREAQTEYRGALLWMKDVSAKLDPEAYNKLDKFRKVQNQVRKAKEQFDKHKLDVLQKVDLLAASRSNMFSHALATYQNALLSFWRKMSKTMNAVSETFQGFQYYEFNMLKSELGETSRELAKETSSERVTELLEGLLKDTGGDNPTSEEDKLIYDIIMSLQDQHETTQKALTKSDEDSSQQPVKERRTSGSMTGLAGDLFEPSEERLIDFDDGELDAEEGKMDQQFGEFQAAMDKETKEFGLLGASDTDKYSALREEGSHLIEDIFGPDQPLLQANSDDLLQSSGAAGSSSFLPADLLDAAGFEDMGMQEGMAGVESDLASIGKDKPPPPPYSPPNPSSQATPLATSKTAWYDLFADLDPLQDPDSLGDQRGHNSNEGCA